jgi:arginine utilization protein RocB
MLSQNTPQWGMIYNIPFEDISTVSMPVINIGPWGKDLHKVGERVNKNDLEYNTPAIIRFVTEYILEK